MSVSDDFIPLQTYRFLVYFEWIVIEKMWLGVDLLFFDRFRHFYRVSCFYDMIG